MARFPKITSPCPLPGDAIPSEGGFHCDRCERTVYDIGEMSQEVRDSFLAAQREKICVRYRIPAHAAGTAALAIAAAVAPSAATADVAVDELIVRPPTDHRVHTIGEVRPLSFVWDGPSRQVAPLTDLNRWIPPRHFRKDPKASEPGSKDED
jgi:hypothetical protein